MRSLALATDLLALRGLATVERRGDHLVVATAHEPGFWSGNMLVRLTPPEDPEAEEARFARAFPGASHLLVAWDDPALDPEPLRAPWAARGAVLEVDDALAREGPPPPAPAPPGYALRELARDADWEAALRLALLVGVGEGGHDEAAHLAYLRRRYAARRAQAAAGGLRWWGAFDGEACVAQLGLVEGVADGWVDGRPLARFQHVETHPAHRRRGLAAALLARAGAATRAPTLVVVAAAGGDARRVYRRAGFEGRERTVAVLRRGR